MNDTEFATLADAALKRIEAALEKCDADLDWEMVNDKVLEIAFADASKIIVNRHDLAQEMWIAARSGGFHFRWDGAGWQDSRHGKELMATLGTLVSQQAGEQITLA